VASAPAERINGKKSTPESGDVAGLRFLDLMGQSWIF